MTKVLITGSNRGIGLALTAEFLRQGDQVIATARHPEQATELQDLAQQYPAAALTIAQMDVVDQGSVDKVAADTAATIGSLDILINNAGVFPEHGDERLEELNMEQLETAFDVNVVGAARVSQAFLPMLRKSARGRIVNISSGAGSITDKTDSRYFCYSVSKAALNQFSRALAADLKAEGIVVAPITPGWVKTDMGGDRAELTPEESAASLVTTIKKLTAKQTGLFLDRHGRSGVYNW
jgi:NAD(P)-dependent dehydrogenase (short-subunit alcohol dehydrogenase family)